MYCTLDDLKASRISEEKLIVLTDENDLGIIDETKVAAAIADAAEVIEGFLRGQYPLPLNPVPGIIKTIAMDLATYGLYGLKPEFNAPETVKDRKTTALSLLTRIQDRKMELYEKAPPPAAGASGVSISGLERQFTRDKLRDF